MKKLSVSFVVLMLLLGTWGGAIAGSLLSRVFGLDFLVVELLPGRGIQVRDFYILKNLELQLNPAALIGLVVTGWLLYRKEKG
jgi:hypothetical protein